MKYKFGAEYASCVLFIHHSVVLVAMHIRSDVGIVACVRASIVCREHSNQCTRDVNHTYINIYIYIFSGADNTEQHSHFQWY